MKVRRVGALTALFFRSGSLTLGGGSSIQAVLQREMVERRRWLSEAEFGLIYGLARFTPGTNVLACTAALGWRLGGWAAAVRGSPKVLAKACEGESKAFFIKMVGDYYRYIAENAKGALMEQVKQSALKAYNEAN